jgi:hypothetical protein
MRDNKFKLAVAVEIAYGSSCAIPRLLQSIANFNLHPVCVRWELPEKAVCSWDVVPKYFLVPVVVKICYDDGTNGRWI